MKRILSITVASAVLVFLPALTAEARTSPPKPADSKITSVTPQAGAGGRIGTTPFCPRWSRPA